MSLAAVVATAHGAATSQDVSIGHVLLQMVVALAIIVGGIWGFGKIMRRGSRGRRGGMLGKARADHGLTVLSRQAVGKGKSIAVVQAGAQCFLVGIADSGLTPLGELKEAAADGADVDHGATQQAQRRPAGVGVIEPEPGRPPRRSALALAPLDLGAIDLSAFAEASRDPGVLAGGPAGHGGGPAGHGGGPAGHGGGPAGPVRRNGPPTVRSWLDALREATVRR